MKYIASNLPLSATKGYPIVDTVNGIPIYENPNALPIALLAHPEIRNVDSGCADYFALHNDIWSGLLGTRTEVLQKEEAVQVSFENLQEEDPGRYVRIDEAAPACVRFEITVSQEKPLYAYFTATQDDQDVFLSVNGLDHGIYFNAYRWDMFTLGTFSPGQIVTVEMTLSKNELDLGQGYFYYEDLDALSQAAAVRREPVELQRISSSHLAGSITAGEDKLLLFTIPFNSGWQLTLDGEPQSCEQILDCLLAVPVSAGTHTFTLRFIPQGLLPGCALTLGALLSAAFWCFRERKKQLPQ